MPAELPDRLKLGEYKLDRLLGRGGSGTVYRGFDPETNQVVAIKLFHENFFASKAHVKELARSATHFRKFDHPNVVKTYGFFSCEDGHCLVMEYVDGPDMKWYIENRPWNLQERLVIVAQICNGLQYIHDQGYTHHDLKPGNILFTRKGQAKVSDYSLSRARLFGMLGGSLKEQITPMYVAPEIIADGKASPKSDMYSLGVTLYYLFTGQLPYQADSLQKLYMCHLRTKPEHPSNINRRCPRPLGDIIMRMLEKNPDKRFESFDELRIRLSDIGQSRI